MTVREMHIDIDQSTQLVAANRSRKWYAEEKDWVLNKVQERYIRSCLRPKKDAQGNLTGGFELDQAKADDIRRLIINKASLIPFIVDSERYKCILPPDYSYLLSDGSRTKLLCGAEPTTASRTYTINRIRQEESGLSNPPYYETMQVQMPGTGAITLVSIPGDLPPFNNYAGYADKKDISFLVPWVIWKAKEWYWERFDDLYYPKWYIRAGVSPTGTSDIIVDGIGLGDVDGIEYADPVTTTRVYTYHTDTGNLVNNRLSGTDIIRNLRQAAFYKTAHYSPITELENDLLWVYRDNSFIVSGVEISYIRKPQPISLSLNTDCELAEGVHRLICDLATEYLQGRVQDLKGVQLSEADLVKRVIL